MEKFQNRRLCIFSVGLDMLLAGASILFYLIVLYAKFTELEPPDVELDRYEYQAPFNSGNFGELFWELRYLNTHRWNPEKLKVLLSALQIFSIIHFVILVLLLFAGQRVFCRAIRITPEETDIKKIKEGMASCKIFCLLELTRLVLMILAFVGELTLYLYYMHLNGAEALQFIFIFANLVGVFGWFFTNEFRKDLKILEEDLQWGPFPEQTNNNQSHDNSRGQNGNIPAIVDNHRNGGQLGNAMAYSTPAVAMYINSTYAAAASVDVDCGGMDCDFGM